jgi:O-antigen/teichoic acid export membrane protein
MAVFLSLHWEIEGLIIAVAGSDVLCIAIALSITLKQIGFEFPRFTHLKQYLAYGLPLIPNGVILWLMLFSNRYIIGYFLGPADVGIYTAAYTLVSVISLFMGPLQTVLFPTISKSYEDCEFDRTRNYMKYSMKYLMLFSIPAVFGISALASPLLLIFTTPQFVAGSVVVPFIAAGIIFYNYYQACIYIVYVVKKTYLEVILLSTTAILNIGLNLLLVPRMGILGAALATLIAYMILGILTVIVAFKYFKFDLNLPFIFKSIFASAVMALAIWLLSPSGFISIAASILLGIVIYFVIIFILKGFSKNELVMVKDLVSGFNIKRH